MFTNTQRSQNARPTDVRSMFKAAMLALRFPSLSQREVQRSAFTCNYFNILPE
jgi:hypothetical protein